MSDFFPADAWPSPCSNGLGAPKFPQLALSTPHMEERLSSEQRSWFPFLQGVEEEQKGVWLRLAGRSGRPRSSRRSVSLICGGWLPQDLVFVARPLSKIEHRRLTPGCSWGCRGLGVRECRDARAASSAATGCRGWSQAIAGSCFGGMERVCVRGSPAGRDAG